MFDFRGVIKYFDWVSELFFIRSSFKGAYTGAGGAGGATGGG